MNKLIALIEDNKDIQAMYASKLSNNGYDVVVYSNCQEALDSARIFDCDFIFIDVLMPIMNGLQCLIKIQQAIGYDKPICILSNINSAELEHAALGLGAKGYFIKSVTTPYMLMEYLNKFFNIKEEINATYPGNLNTSTPINDTSIDIDTSSAD